MDLETYEALYVALVRRLGEITRLPSKRQIAVELVKIVPVHEEIVKREKGKTK